MTSYSLDLRERIVSACEQGESDVSVAKRFGVCTKTVQRYRRRALEGQLAHIPYRGRAPHLKKEQEAAFIAMVTAHPTWTLKEYGEAWQAQTGVWLPKSTLHEHLVRLGGRFKKRVWSPKSAAK